MIWQSNLSAGLILNLELIQVSQDQVNNSSLVKERLFVTGTGNGAWSNYSTSGYIIGNQRYDFSLPSYSFSNGSSINLTLIERTFTIYHDGEGRATVNGSGYWNPNNPYLNAASVSGRLALTQITRADVHEAYNIIAGQNTYIPFTITQKYGLATKYMVKIAVGGYSVEKWIYDTSQYSYNVELTQQEWNNLYANDTNVPEVTYALLLYTYNGDTLVGYNTRYATLIFSESDRPTLDYAYLGTHVYDTNSNISSKLGDVFLQGLSSIRITFPNATAYSGAEINGYEILIQDTGTVATFNTNNVTWASNKAGNFTIYMRVRDTRGRWSDYRTVDIQVLSYSYPYITEFKTNRTTDIGEVSPTGTYITAVISGNVASVYSGGYERNSLVYKIEDITSGTVSKVGPTSVLNTSINGITRTFGTYALGEVYKVKLTISDAFGGTAAQVVTIARALLPFVIAEIGCAIGGDYEENDLEGQGLQAFNTAHFHDTVTFEKPIVIKGQENHGLIEKVGSELNGYEKYGNGKLVQFKMVQIVDLAFPNTLGNSFYSDVQDLGWWQTEFIDDSINISLTKETTAVLTTLDIIKYATRYAAPKVIIGRVASSGSITSIKLYIRAEGRWK